MFLANQRGWIIRDTASKGVTIYDRGGFAFVANSVCVFTAISAFDGEIIVTQGECRRPKREERWHTRTVNTTTNMKTYELQNSCRKLRVAKRLSEGG